jgi:hypothetical protein
VNRRDLLKGLFGTAVIAAVPTIVMKRIDELPPPEYSPNHLIESDDVGKVYTGPLNPEDNILYLYDENQLVGSSSIFNLKMEQNFIPMAQSRWVKLPWDGRYYKNKKTKKGLPKKKHRWQIIEDYNAPVEHIQGLKSWWIETDNMFWEVDPRELIKREPTSLHCIMAKDNIKFYGDVYLANITLVAALEDPERWEALFEGSDELIVTVLKG